MYKLFEKTKKGDIRGEWRKVSDLFVGMEIAVPVPEVVYASATFPPDTERSDDILWDEIVSIEHVGREQVWDIEVEGTHNFVGNDIFAHNTYILKADPFTGIVGIGNDGTQLGNEKLRVSGRILATGFDTDANADLSERFPADEAVDQGTVVAFSTTNSQQLTANSDSNTFTVNTGSSTDSYQTTGVRKATNGYEAVGVVSTNPGIILGSASAVSCQPSAVSCSSGVPVAFMGRVPVKVTTENGEIKVGDYLTVSRTMPGYAMKLTGEGRALGRALSDYIPGREKILMLIENGNQKLDTNGRTATTTGMLTMGNVDLNANAVSIINIKSLASASGTWSIDENGRITARMLCLEDVCIDKTQLSNILNSTGQSGTANSGQLTANSGNATSTATTTETVGSDQSQPEADQPSADAVSSDTSTATTTEAVSSDTATTTETVVSDTTQTTETTPIVETPVVELTPEITPVESVVETSVVEPTP